KYSFLLAKSLLTLSSHIELMANTIDIIIHMLLTLPYNVFTNAKHCSCPMYLSSACSLLSIIVGTVMIKNLIASSGVSSASIYSTSISFLLNASFTSGHFVQCVVLNIYNLLILLLLHLHDYFSNYKSMFVCCFLSICFTIKSFTFEQ